MENLFLVILVVLRNIQGTRIWYKEGKYHRLNHPAFEGADGTRYWYKKGKYHRINVPAVEYPDGIVKEWAIEDIFYTIKKIVKFNQFFLLHRKRKRKIQSSMVKIFNRKWN